MSKCHGCHQPLQLLSEIRTYHSGCDPHGRAAYLERVLTQVHDWLKPQGSIMRGEELCIAPHGWDVVRKLVAEAIDYRPVSPKAKD